MDPVKVILAILALVIVGAAYRSASTMCRRAPTWRPWLIAGSIISLCLLPLLLPWVYALDPSLRESPAGLLVLLPKAAAVSVLALAAVGALIGALFPGHSRPTADGRR